MKVRKLEEQENIELRVGDTFSWKGQLESFKLKSLKLESFVEVGVSLKSQAKLESSS